LFIQVPLAVLIALSQSADSANRTKVRVWVEGAFLITFIEEIPEGPAGVATDSKLDEGAVKITEEPEGRAIREGRAQSRRAKLQGTISLSAAVANNGIAPSAEVALWSPTKAIRARSQCGGLRVPQVLAGKPAIGRGHGLRNGSDNVGKQAGPKELMAGKGKPRVIKIHVVVGASIVGDEVRRLIPDCCAPFEWRDKHGGPEGGSEFPYRDAGGAHNKGDSRNARGICRGWQCLRLQSGHGIFLRYRPLLSLLSRIISAEKGGLASGNRTVDVSVREHMGISDMAICAEGAPANIRGPKVQIIRVSPSLEPPYLTLGVGSAKVRIVLLPVAVGKINAGVAQKGVRALPTTALAGSPVLMEELGYSLMHLAFSRLQGIAFW
jgi:hypothetical protein